MASLRELRRRFLPYAAIDSRLVALELELRTLRPPLEMPGYFECWAEINARLSKTVGAGARHESLRTREAFDAVWNYCWSCFQTAAYRASEEGAA